MSESNTTDTPVKTGLGAGEDPSAAKGGKPKDGSEGDGDNDAKRAAFQQARADKLEEMVKQFAPLINAVTKHPQLIDVIEKEIKSIAGAAQPAKPTKPTRPAKPSNYNPAEAVTDPTSPSYKYREDLVEYNERLIEYQESLVGELSQRDAVERRREQEAEQRKAQVTKLTEVLTTKHKMSIDEVQAFIRETEDPQMWAVDNVVAFWRSTKKKPTGRDAGNPAGQSAAGMSLEGRGSAAPPDETESFIESIKAHVAGPKPKG